MSFAVVTDTSLNIRTGLFTEVYTPILFTQ